MGKIPIRSHGCWKIWILIYVQGPRILFFEIFHSRKCYPPITPSTDLDINRPRHQQTTPSTSHDIHQLRIYRPRHLSPRYQPATPTSDHASHQPCHTPKHHPPTTPSTHHGIYRPHCPPITISNNDDIHLPRHSPTTASAGCQKTKFANNIVMSMVLGQGCVR